MSTRLSSGGSVSQETPSQVNGRWEGRGGNNKSQEPPSQSPQAAKETHTYNEGEEEAELVWCSQHGGGETGRREKGEEQEESPKAQMVQPCSSAEEPGGAVRVPAPGGLLTQAAFLTLPPQKLLKFKRGQINNAARAQPAQHSTQHSTATALPAHSSPGGATSQVESSSSLPCFWSLR